MDAKRGRDNEAWLVDLRGDGPSQRAAISDLRGILLRSLHGALERSASINESFLEDTVQDALIQILEHLDQFEGRSRFLTWATSIAVRGAMTQLRRKHWKDISLEQLLADDAEPSDIFASPRSKPDEDQARTALVNKMMNVIDDELTDRQRTALLAELKGVPQSEIARHFGGNRNSIYKLTHDARKRVKQGLEAAGYGVADIQMAFVN